MIRLHSGSATLPIPAAWIADDEHPPHAVRMGVGEVGDDPDHQIGGVLTDRPVHRLELILAEVVLLERPGGKRVLWITVPGQQGEDVRRVNQAPLAEPGDLLLTLGQGFEGFRVGATHPHAQRLSGRVVECERDRTYFARARGPDARHHFHLLEAHALGIRTQPVGESSDLLLGQVQDWPEIQHDVVDDHPTPIRAPGLESTNRPEDVVEHALEIR